MLWSCQCCSLTLQLVCKWGYISFLCTFFHLEFLIAFSPPCIVSLTSFLSFPNSQGKYKIIWIPFPPQIPSSCSNLDWLLCRPAAQLSSWDIQSVLFWVGPIFPGPRTFLFLVYSFIVDFVVVLQYPCLSSPLYNSSAIWVGMSPPPALGVDLYWYKPLWVILPASHSDDWFTNDPITLMLSTLPFLREDEACLPLHMKKEVCSLVTAVSHLVNMLRAYLRMELTNGRSRTKRNGTQRNGTIVLIIPRLKSALPMDFSVMCANKLQWLLKPFWIAFYTTCTWKCSNILFCCLPLFLFF